MLVDQAKAKNTLKHEDKVWMQLEEQQIQNYDKMEELNKQARKKKMLDEHKMREQIIEEKNEMLGRVRQQEDELDRSLVEQANAQLEHERRKAQELKESEKQKLLEIYAENSKRRAQHKRQVQKQRDEDNELMQQ